MRIDIGRYRLESYALGWTIGKPRVRKNTDGNKEEYLADQSYPGTLTQALTSLQDIWVRESSCESVEEILVELRSFRAELAGLFTIQAREPDKKRSRRISS